jgi:hypothetical protein
MKPVERIDCIKKILKYNSNYPNKKKYIKKIKMKINWKKTV